jgi:hypothetical protein
MVNNNELVKVLSIPGFIMALGIIFIVFRRFLGRHLFNMHKFFSSQYESATHMKTLLRPLMFNVKKNNDIEDYQRKLLELGIFVISSAIFITFFLWVKGVF